MQKNFAEAAIDRKVMYANNSPTSKGLQLGAACIVAKVAHMTTALAPP